MQAGHLPSVSLSTLLAHSTIAELGSPVPRPGLRPPCPRHLVYSGGSFRYPPGPADSTAAFFSSRCCLASVTTLQMPCHKVVDYGVAVSVRFPGLRTYEVVAMNVVARLGRLWGVPSAWLLLSGGVAGLAAACGGGAELGSETLDDGGSDPSNRLDRVAEGDVGTGADLTDGGLADGREGKPRGDTDVHDGLDAPELPEVLDPWDVKLDAELDPWDVEEDYWGSEPPEAGCVGGFPPNLGGVECIGSGVGVCPAGFEAVDFSCRPAECVEAPDSCCATPATVVATNTPSSQCKGRYLEVPQDDGGICVPSGVGPLEGVFRSENQGGCYSVVACPSEVLWRHPGFEGPKWAEAPVAFSPLDPEVVLAAAGSRVLLSHDGGLTFKYVAWYVAPGWLGPYHAGAASSFAFDADGQTAYVGFSVVGGYEYSGVGVVNLGTGEAGIMQLPSAGGSMMEAPQLAADPNEQAVLYAGGNVHVEVVGGTRYALMRSQDGGATWEGMLPESVVGPEFRLLDVAVRRRSGQGFDLVGITRTGVWSFEPLTQEAVSLIEFETVGTGASPVALAVWNPASANGAAECRLAATSEDGVLVMSNDCGDSWHSFASNQVDSIGLVWTLEGWLLAAGGHLQSEGSVADAGLVRKWDPLAESWRPLAYGLPTVLVALPNGTAGCGWPPTFRAAAMGIAASPVQEGVLLTNYSLVPAP